MSKTLTPSDITTEKNEQLEQRCCQKFERLLTEARTCISAILLPTNMIANGDEDIQKDLDDQIERLTINLLEHKTSHDEVNAVCGKLARHIAIPEVVSAELGSKFYPEHAPRPSAAEREHLLGSKHSRAGFYEIVYQECDGFAAKIPLLRTWHET